MQEKIIIIEKETDPFSGSMAVLSGLLDAVLVSLIGLVMSCVVLGLRHSYFSVFSTQKKVKIFFFRNNIFRGS